MRRTNWLFLLGLSAIAWAAIDHFSSSEAATLYVANFGDDSIVTVDSTGSVHPFVNNAKALSIAFDASGVLYASQYNVGGLIKVSPAGVQSPLASGLSFPGGVAVDGNNNVFVAESNATVAKVTPGGQVSTFATGGQLTRPTDLAFDSLGRLIFCDFRTSSVGSIAANGTVTIIASGLGNTQAVALDSSDNIFVSDVQSHAIYKVTEAGMVSVVETGLQTVEGLVYDRQAGVLYASDRATNAIYKVAQGGQATLFASGFVDPVGIAFSPVPEPASIILCGLGTAGLFCVARRRKIAGKKIVANLLVLAMVAATAGRVQATTLTFEGQATAAEYTHLLSTYGGLSWSGFFALNNSPTLDGLTGGYNTGAVSGTTVAEAQVGKITSTTPFTFDSAYLTAAYNDNLSVLVQGLRSGSVTYATTYMVNTEVPSFITFNYANIDELRVTSSGGTQVGYIGHGNGENVVVDDFTFHTVPEPASIILCGLGTAGLFCIARLRKKTETKIVACLLLFVMLSATATAVQAGNLVANGSFESPGFTSPPYYRYLSNGDTSITGWRVMDDGIGEAPYWYKLGGLAGSIPYVVHDGSYAVALDQGSSISTTLSIVAGTRYSLSFWATSDRADIAPLLVNVAGASSTFAFPQGVVGFSFIATATDAAAKLEFINNSSVGDYKNYAIDDVQVSVVPEPATIMLLGIGLLTFVTCFRSRIHSTRR